MIKHAFIFLSLILFITGCKKNAAKENSAFVGTWSQDRKNTKTACEPYVLEITAAGNGSHYTRSAESECYKSERCSGKAKIKGSKLYIGRWNSFKIDQEPTAIEPLKMETGAGMIEAHMMLVIDGRTYYKE